MTLGMRPRRAASRISNASPVVSIQPDQGGSVQVVEGAFCEPLGPEWLSCDILEWWGVC